ncbi:MAG: MarR family transcriptional regulator [Actinobacteria bacterium]|nr:MarR family transcriptional regulator [Actinomycetota bacterium]
MVDTIALSYLRGERSLSAGELAARVGLSRSSMTSLLDRLEGGGFAQRSVPRENRRRVEISLTDADINDPDEAARLLCALATSIHEHSVQLLNAPTDPG